MAWIMAYHDGNWHLTKHISVVSTSYCDSMYLACALAHSMELSALKFSPISFTLTLTQSTIHVLIIFFINLKIHHYIMTNLGLCYLSFSKNITMSWKHLEPNLPSTYLPHGTPSSSLCLLQGAKKKKTDAAFFDLIPEIWEQSLLKLCC